MSTHTRLTLENGTDEQLTSRLEYLLSSGERIVMEIPLPKNGPGAGSRTLLQIEAAILQRTADICHHTLAEIKQASE